MIRRVLFQSLAPEFHHVRVVEPLPHLLYCHRVHLLYFVVIALLLPLLQGFTPATRTVNIPKYSSIE
jgi:hypothetical protein